MPHDVGLQIEIGRTSKGDSFALPEESPASTVDEGRDRSPSLGSCPKHEGSPLASSEVSVSHSSSSLPAPPGGIGALPV